MNAGLQNGTQNIMFLIVGAPKNGAPNCWKLPYSLDAAKAGLDAISHLSQSARSTVKFRKLENDCPPSPHQRKKDNQPKPSHIHISTFWSLLYQG